MKELFLIRHAKSSWRHPELEDIDRPLKKNGVETAYDMARGLQEEELKPDIVIASPAVRAFHTAIIFSRVLKFPLEKIHLRTEIYVGGVGEVMGLLQVLGAKTSRVFVFGHIPLLPDLANHYLDEPIEHIPTAGILGIQFKKRKPKSASTHNGSIMYHEFPGKARQLNHSRPSGPV